MSPSLALLLSQALSSRAPLLERLHAEQTDAYRLFHGSVEGAPGLTVDRYGDLVLVQSFHAPLDAEALRVVEGFYEGAMPGCAVVYNDRSGAGSRVGNPLEGEALSAAMKLLVNSAYGYLGAVGLTRFADVHAANEVTRRGREVLDTICRALAGRGVTLLEGDTDGVYFAVPAGWTEDDERRVVREVGERREEDPRAEAQVVADDAVGRATPDVGEAVGVGPDGDDAGARVPAEEPFVFIGCSGLGRHG